MNFKGKYDSLECEACQENEEESQQHIINCKILNENNENIGNVPEYEEIYNGNTKMKLKIAKLFLENIKNRENLKKRDKS